MGFPTILESTLEKYLKVEHISYKKTTENHERRNKEETKTKDLLTMNGF